MKQLFLLIVIIQLSSCTVYAQFGINSDGSQPDSSAVLDVKSTTQGMLIPRMTQSQIEMIQSPVNGLMVFCTTDNKIYIFNSAVSLWKAVKSGTATISPISFICGQTLTDPRDGQTYATLKIGTQCWMAKYLNIGTKISASVNQINNSIIEKYCYDDNEANCAIYGGMYQWDEMMNYTASSSASPSGRQGICPSGWHVPSDDELNLLRTFAGGEYTAGGNLKEVGTSHWAYPNSGATNLYGFTALPCGFSYPGGSFNSLSNYTNLPSATETSSDHAWKYGMQFDNTTVARGSILKSTGTTVRCLKDPNPGIPTVTTTPITNINETTATSGGIVITEGGITVTARGVCWDTTANPTITDSHTTDGSGTGPFVSSLTGLNANTLYYVRAYATNSIGTAYGIGLSFTTLPTLVLPIVTTASITNITHTNATCGGNVISAGGDSVTARGVCWSTISNPTTSDSHTTDGSGTGTFLSSLTGLTAHTLYYVRAYATNSIGTAYGNVLSFTTLPIPVPPIVTTTAITNITQTNATSGGNVTSDGGANVTARGVCWSTTSNPTTYDSHTTDGSGTGAFISNLTGLIPNTLYYVRAYATNGSGTAYGNQLSFTTSDTSNNFICGSALTDSRDGKTYTTVQLGSQCWMAQNLNIGTRIDGLVDQTDNSTIEKYCYNNFDSVCDTYGGLYQWDEAMQYSTTEGVKGICPAGWHLPGNAEWTVLTNFVGSQPEYLCNNTPGWIAVAMAANTFWISAGFGCGPGDDPSQNNATGFSGLPAGQKFNYGGDFGGMFDNGTWWGSSAVDVDLAWCRVLTCDYQSVFEYGTYKYLGVSVRCVKDN